MTSQVPQSEQSLKHIDLFAFVSFLVILFQEGLLLAAAFHSNSKHSMPMSFKNNESLSPVWESFYGCTLSSALSRYHSSSPCIGCTIELDELN